MYVCTPAEWSIDMLHIHWTKIQPKCKSQLCKTRIVQSEANNLYSAMTDLLLSLSEQDFIRTGCATNCRGDGRAATEFRHSTITTPGPIPMSHGSARLTSADGLQTMLCSVKAELVAPSQHQPRHGSIVVSVDQHGVTNRSQMRESQVALQQRLQWVDDLTTLCVVPGAAVWRLHVDLLVIISS